MSHRFVTRLVLSGAVVLAGQVVAQSDAERARMDYERQQREYWRKQEEERMRQWNQQQQQEAFQRQQRESEAEQKKRSEDWAKMQSSSGAAVPVAPPSGDAGAEIEALRKKLEKQPALAPDRNPLLGRWRLQTKAPANSGGLGDLLGAITSGACQMLFGDGIWDFRPKAMFGIDQVVGEHELDQVEYRGGAKAVAVLPRRMWRLLMFEFDSPDRIRFSLQDCVLVRVDPKGARQAAGSPTIGVGLPSAAPNRAVESQAPARPSTEVCSLTLLDKLGAVGLNQVRQVLDVRYTETLRGTVPGSGHLRLDARGSACDDPRLNATLYDFDANGTLQAVTYVWARPPSPAPAPIFSERVKTLLLHHPSLPPPQSTGRLQADTPLGRLVLQDLPERGLLLEAYAARR